MKHLHSSKTADFADCDDGLYFFKTYQAKFLSTIMMPFAKVFRCTVIGFVLSFFAVTPAFSQSLGKLEWQTDLATATEMATRQNKLVLLHFTADWSRPSNSLDTFVFTTPRVQRAINANCVPVRVDVDHHDALVKEYAVASVPFDIVLTPGGRVVARRNSPRDASAFADMIEELDVVIHSLAGGDQPALKQNLNDFKPPESNAVKIVNNIVKNPTIIPEAPVHSAPDPSQDSRDLARKFSGDKYDDSTSLSPSPVNAPSPSKGLQAADAQLRVKNLFCTDESQDSANSRQNSAIPTTASPGSFEGRAEVGLTGLTESVAPAGSAATRLLAGYSDDKTILETKFALHGKCPVTLLTEGRWVAGDPKFGCVHRQRLYCFTSQQNLEKFQQDPDAYSPLLAGYDPVVFSRNGELVDGIEQHGVFMGQAPNRRVVLFQSQETREEFEANPEDYIDTIRQAMNSTGGQSSPVLR